MSLRAIDKTMRRSVRGMRTNRLDHATERCICEVARITAKRMFVEFVDTEEIELVYRGMGVDSTQGHYRHEPMQIADLQALRDALPPDGDTGRPASLS